MKISNNYYQYSSNGVGTCRGDLNVEIIRAKCKFIVKIAK